MIRITDTENLEQIYHYQLQFQTPYFFAVGYDDWEKSFREDVDGAGRTLFKSLFLKAAYEGTEPVGFIQYGETAFGFDDRGEISSDVSYCVIRNLYFDPDHPDAGAALLREALDAFSGRDKIYAFFHYFGMSCFARHGKLFEKHEHIGKLLEKNGFETEHENVYYSSRLKGDEASEAVLLFQNPTEGNQQYMDFVLGGSQVGGCEIHRVDDQTAYLRWIYINENATGKGIGTACMKALKHWLYESGVRRFDTDTALSNTVAQHFYEKNSFVREGITRSFYRA